MQIDTVSVYRLRIPMRMTVTHASQSRRSNDTLIVSCRSIDGTTGWGEGLPRTYVTGETIESAFNELSLGKMIPQILGRRFNDLADVVRACREIDPGPRPDGTRSGYFNSPRCALELSLLDAATRHLQVPFGEIVQWIPEVDGLRQAANEVRYSAIFPELSSWKNHLYSRWIRFTGMKHVKVKVGIPGIDDATKLRTIRKGIGPRVDLRVDANEAWSARELSRRVEELIPFNVTSIEQPVPCEQLQELKNIRGQSQIPIMLDESVCTREDLTTVIENGYADLINLRISKCGGPINSCLMASMAHQSGIGYQLGCQVGETGILSAAGRHLATSLTGFRYFEGSYDRYLLREQFTRPDITCRWTGWAPALTGVGLGIDVDRAILQSMIVRENHFHARS